MPKDKLKKPIMGGLKTGSKYLAAGMLMGGRVELASYLIYKGQNLDNVSEYILMEDIGPSFAHFDSIESSIDGSTRSWLPGFKSLVTWVISSLSFILFLYILIRCCLKKCIKKTGLSSLFGSWTLSRGPTAPSPRPSQDPCSTAPLDMELEFEKLENGQHQTQVDNGKSFHAEHSNELKDVFKRVHDSAVAQARAAHEADLEYQKCEE